MVKIRLVKARILLTSSLFWWDVCKVTFMSIITVEILFPRIRFWWSGVLTAYAIFDPGPLVVNYGGILTTIRLDP